jgi:general secretion pathway protein H
MMLLPMLKHNRGFTLLEVMMVIVVVGIMASLVQFNFNSNRPEDLLKRASERFVAVFDVASEYALLNNVEIGLIISDNSYQFLGYDGVRWSEVPEQPLFALYNLSEGLIMTLKLDDLPIEEPLLFDAAAYVEQQKSSEDTSPSSIDCADEKTDKKANDNCDNETNSATDNARAALKKRIPQVYILSGGDISAFSLNFSLSNEALFSLDLEQAITYRVSGLYSTPLKIELVDAQGDAFAQE